MEPKGQKIGVMECWSIGVMEIGDQSIGSSYSITRLLHHFTLMRES